MKNRTLVSIFISVLSVMLIFVSCATKQKSYVAKDEEEICGTDMSLQEGNNLPISQLQPMQSGELENNRIGVHFSGLWHPWYESTLFPDLGGYDTNVITELGLKRIRMSINAVSRLPS